MLFITPHDIVIYLTRHWLEILAAVISIAGVWLTAWEKAINWPISIIGCFLSVLILLTKKQYGDMALSVFYILFSFYGWYEWLHGGKNKQAIEISRINFKTLLIFTLITIVCTWGLYSFMKYFTDNSIPFLDSATTVFSLSCTWMMAKKYIENWLLWIVIDATYIVQYTVTDLYPFAILSFIFTLLAVYGYFEWKKLMKVSYA